MSPAFNSLVELEAYLLLKVQKAMEVTVAPEVKKLESENVREVVYNSYPSPSEYVRREEHGGLSDVNNMHHEIFAGGNMVVLSVDNETMSNPAYMPNYKDQFQIAGLVEYGNNNGHGEYDYPYHEDYLKARAFIEVTKNQLESGKVKELFIEGLAKEGISVI